MDVLESEESGRIQSRFCPGLDPYRDDPPAPKKNNPELSDRNDLSGSDALSHEVSSVSRPVCTCGKCITNIAEEDRKCCQDVPGWQEQYNFEGLFERIFCIMFIHYSYSNQRVFYALYYHKDSSKIWCQELPWPKHNT